MVEWSESSDKNGGKLSANIFKRGKKVNYSAVLSADMPVTTSSSTKSNLIRVFVKGGFLSPADLLKIMNLSRSLGNRYILFGSRQDIMFPSNGSHESVLTEAFKEIGID